jgi:hypothetical protein
MFDKQLCASAYEIRAYALLHTAGLERMRLLALADTVMAESRVQTQLTPYRKAV